MDSAFNFKVIFTDMFRVKKYPVHVYLAEVKQGNALLSGFTSHTTNKCRLCGLLSTMVFTMLCFLLVVLLFKMTPKFSVKVQCSVLKSKRVICLCRET